MAQIPEDKLKILADKICTTHNITPLPATVRYNKRIKRARCIYPNVHKNTGHIIEFNPEFVKVNTIDTFIQVLKHECSHIKHRGHDSTFNNFVLSIGGVTQFEKHFKEKKLLGKVHIYECPSCKRELERRNPKKSTGACAICCNKYSNGKYDAKFNYQFKEIRINNPPKTI